MEFSKFRRKGHAEMRPYVPGEDLSGVSVSKEDMPSEGGMIARNPDNHLDQWYVAKAYFEKHFEPVLVALLLLVLAGCTSFFSTETCTPQKDGYYHCAGLAQWEREPACNGSCKP